MASDVSAYCPPKPVVRSKGRYEGQFGSSCGCESMRLGTSACEHGNRACVGTRLSACLDTVCAQEVALRTAALGPARRWSLASGAVTVMLSPLGLKLGRCDTAVLTPRPSHSRVIGYCHFRNEGRMRHAVSLIRNRK
jgi:hypothetical protein